MRKSMEGINEKKLSLMRKYNMEVFIFFLIFSCVYILRLYVGSSEKVIEIVNNNTKALIELKETIKNK